MIIHTDRAYDRKEILIDQIKQDLRIHLRDLADKTDILAIRITLLYLQQIAVLTGNTHGMHAQLFHHGYQTLVDFVQYHFGDLHGLGIGHTQAVDKLCLLADLLHPRRDLLAAAMHDDRFESDQLEQGHVFDDILLQLRIRHSTPAVFYHDDPTVKLLNIGKCLDQHLRLFDQFINIFRIHFFILPNRFLMTGNPH